MILHPPHILKLFLLYYETFRNKSEKKKVLIDDEKELDYNDYVFGQRGMRV
jgi:hypothetical protein